MQDLRGILAAREALCRRADAVVDTTGQDAQRSLTELRQAVGV